MSADRVWAIKQFTFNGVTYDAATGMPLDWDYEDSSNEIPDRVADQVYAGAILIPEKDMLVSITMRDPYTSIAKGTKSNLAMQLVKNDGTGYITMTFAGMVFTSQRGGGTKSTPAQATLSFRYEGDGVSRIARS